MVLANPRPSALCLPSLIWCPGSPALCWGETQPPPLPAMPWGWLMARPAVCSALPISHIHATAPWGGGDSPKRAGHPHVPPTARRPRPGSGRSGPRPAFQALPAAELQPHETPSQSRCRASPEFPAQTLCECGIVHHAGCQVGVLATLGVLTTLSENVSSVRGALEHGGLWPPFHILGDETSLFYPWSVVGWTVSPQNSSVAVLAPTSQGDRIWKQGPCRCS